jgi:hypothetical protein
MTAAGPVSLATVVDDFLDEVRGIESIFDRYRGHRSIVGFEYSYVPLEDGCLISLWDAWSRLLRRLVIASASSVTVGLGGGIYSPSMLRSETQVLQYLSANAKGRNFGIINGEPKWNGPVNLANIVGFLGLPNGNQIVAAVSSTSISLGPITVQNPLEEVRICRNYVAHKAPTTLANVHRYAVGRYVDFSSHLRWRRSGVETFSEWCECLEALAGAAAQ